MRLLGLKTKGLLLSSRQEQSQWNVGSRWQRVKERMGCEEGQERADRERDVTRKPKPCVQIPPPTSHTPIRELLPPCVQFWSLHSSCLRSEESNY